MSLQEDGLFCLGSSVDRYPYTARQRAAQALWNPLRRAAYYGQTETLNRLLQNLVRKDFLHEKPSIGLARNFVEETPMDLAQPKLATALRGVIQRLSMGDAALIDRHDASNEEFTSRLHESARLLLAHGAWTNEVLHPWTNEIPHPVLSDFWPGVTLVELRMEGASLELGVSCAATGSPSGGGDCRSFLVGKLLSGVEVKFELLLLGLDTGANFLTFDHGFFTPALRYLAQAALRTVHPYASAELAWRKVLFLTRLQKKFFVCDVERIQLEVADFVDRPGGAAEEVACRHTIRVRSPRSEMIAV